jgi:hypothetical protein
MNKFLKRVTSKRGDSTLIIWPLVVLGFWSMLFFQIETLGKFAENDNLHQMSQIMAREISLTGKVDEDIESRLEDLENSFDMDVDMDVDGEFIGHGKLKLESPVEVTLSYKTTYKCPFIKKTKEKTYVAKSVETVEEYHK